MSSATKSVTSEPSMRIDAIAFPRRKERFGRPYTMLNADSSTLKSDSAVQSRNAPPTMPSVAALSCTSRTSVTMSPTGASGNACLSSVTRKLDSSARPARPSSASARNVSGTKERSAKYAIIAARCVPRSAKNFANRARFLSFNKTEYRAARGCRPVNDAELRRALKQHAYLEGDFVLRSGRHSRYYLDKYRFETRPDLLRAIGERLAAQIREHEPEAARIAGPELGAVALA